MKNKFKDRIKIYYLRSEKDNKPIVTVAFSQNNQNPNLVDRAVAVCSEKDNPCKKIGRKIAIARLQKMVGTGINDRPETFESKVLGAIFTEIVGLAKTPTDLEAKSLRIELRKNESN